MRKQTQTQTTQKTSTLLQTTGGNSRTTFLFGNRSGYRNTELRR